MSQGLRVQSQSRAYAAVIGVAVGMLVAGLGVPLAFGRTPEPASAAAPDIELTIPGEELASPPGATDPGAEPGLQPGTGPEAQPGPQPTTAPVPVPTTAPVPVPTSAPTTTAPVDESQGPLTASDQGVTASSIKLGVVLLDIEALKPLGFGQPHYTPAEQREAYQVVIDEINADGGLLGRKIVPEYVTNNALDSSGSTSAGAVCTKLAEDEKVFAAMGQLGGNIAECLTAQHGIPAIDGGGHLREAFAKAKGLLISSTPSIERMGTNFGDLAVRTGLLKGRTVGTLYVDVPESARAESAMSQGVSSAGGSIKFHGKLSNDAASAQAQMPIVARQMQTSGVNTVMLTTSFVTAVQFAQTAQALGFRPMYVVSDIGALTAETLVGSMPTSFDGAYGFTSLIPTSPEPAVAKDCRNNFNAKAGKNYGTGADAGAVYAACTQLTIFAEAAERAGTKLTRSGLAGGVGQLGAIQLAQQLGGSFGPSKPDYGDFYRPIRYSRACECYRSLGGAQRGRY